MTPSPPGAESSKSLHEASADTLMLLRYLVKMPRGWAALKGFVERGVSSDGLRDPTPLHSPVAASPCEGSFLSQILACTHEQQLGLRAMHTSEPCQPQTALSPPPSHCPHNLSWSAEVQQGWQSGYGLCRGIQSSPEI